MYLQVGVAGSRLAANPAVFQLGEMGLEEGDLVLVCCAGDVCGGALDGEVVEYCALVDGGFGLRDELGAPHVAVPFCGIVDGDFSALLAASIAGVFVVGREVDWGWLVWGM